jgi:hypothetical protein
MQRSMFAMALHLARADDGMPPQAVQNQGSFSFPSSTSGGEAALGARAHCARMPGWRAVLAAQRQRTVPARDGAGLRRGRMQ